VANVVENIENMAGKGGVVTTPQKKKRQKKTNNDSLEDFDTDLASSEAGVHQDQ
jgi:hypothetical protein